MSSSLDCLDLCRLCLIKDRVSVPIFEDEGDVRQIFLKITACLPVKVSRDDKLPKKICDDCVYKVELFYQFWNTTANAEKQLLQWLGEVDLEDKQTYVTEVLDTNVMKQEQNSDNRLEGNVIQVSGHQNNMDIGMIEDMTIMTIPAGSEQQFTTVPMDTSGTVQTVQAVPGPSTHDQMGQSQTHLVTEEVEESEEEENSDDGCDNEEGLPVKEETEEVQTETFVNVPISCDEAGPSGLQQQKVTEMSEMSMTQTATDGDPKTGNRLRPCYVLLERLDNRTSQRTSKGVNSTNFEMIELKPIIKIESLEIDPLEILQNCSIDMKLETPDYDEENHEIYYTQNNELNNLVNNSEVTNTEQIIIGDTGTNIYNVAHKVVDISLEEAASSNKNKVARGYFCEICEISFPQRDMLIEHGQIMHDKTRMNKSIAVNSNRFNHRISINSNIADQNKKNTYTLLNSKHICSYCNIEFNNSSVLTSHIIRLHPNKLISNEALRSKSKATGYACNYCNFVGVSKTSTDRHMMFEHLGEKQPALEIPATEYDCDQCNFKTNYRYRMKNHISSKHAIPPNADGIFVCNMCPFEAPLSRNLEEHISFRHYKKKCFDNDNQNYYRCDQCNFESFNQRILSWHKERHANDLSFNEYFCDHCKLSTWTKKKLIAHMRKNHKQFVGIENRPNKRNISCDQCNYKTDRSAFMRRHRQTVHNTKLSSDCEICGKKYKNKNILDIHVKLEHNKNSIICNVCSKICEDKKSLCMHQKALLEGSDSNISTRSRRINTKTDCRLCDNECGNYFKKNCVQHVHGKSYVCNICNQMFTQKTTLEEHIVLTHENLNYFCKQCSSSFKTNAALHSHKRVHKVRLT